ncbi:superoxide dismutase family protein [uncultured Paludibaculum sp.]|uniref:superoxide dismutase family protein n=1 Tax=uncultured Paludibaculum sp. TaxID=1765020 RepID=UPI002AAA72DE|nr:superoxide dismutase family protein [uncultured Paludibaculum sp.]
MTTRSILAATTALAFSVLTLAGAQGERKAATAQVKDAKDQVVATAQFKQVKTGVQLSVKATGLPPGIHAIHVHAVGKCEAPGFTTAGGHFNPAHKQHGMMNPAGHHAGDMPNLTINAKGKGTFKTVIEGVTLAGDGDTSLFHSGGTALVIHEKEDDMKSDPAGNAGARLACGVVQ